MISQVDFLGHITFFTYDGNGYVTTYACGGMAPLMGSGLSLRQQGHPPQLRDAGAGRLRRPVQRLSGRPLEAGHPGGLPREGKAAVRQGAGGRRKCRAPAPVPPEKTVAAAFGPKYNGDNH